MNFKKNFRLIGYLAIVLIASLFLLYSEFSKPTGVVAVFVDPKSPCRDIIAERSTITEVAGMRVKDTKDFERLTKGLNGIITFIVNENPRSCDIPENVSLGITVEDIKKTGLNLGVDVAGGKFYIYKPENNSQKILRQIKIRAKEYGLANTRVEPYENNTLRIITGLEEEKYVRLLVERGKLEGKLIMRIGENEFILNDKTYRIALKDEKTVIINNTEQKVGKDFILDGINLKIENISKNETVISVKIFDEKDLTFLKDPASSRRLMKQGGNYVFVLNVLLSKEASENFAKATKGQEVIINPTTGESFLKNSLVIAIDGKETINLPISGDDAGKEKDVLVIWSYGSNKENVINEMLRLSALIESKSLDTNIIQQETGDYNIKSGKFLVFSLLCLIFLFIVSTSIFFLAKYRKKGIVIIPNTLLCLGILPLIISVVSFEWFIFLILFFGIASALIKGEITGWEGWVAISFMFMISIGTSLTQWVLGIPSLLGLMVVVCISLGQAVFISYKILKGKETYTLTDYKNSLKKIWFFSMIFFVILFGFFVFGEAYREFAMTLTLGLMIATTLTTPLSYSIAEKVTK